MEKRRPGPYSSLIYYISLDGLSLVGWFPPMDKHVIRHHEFTRADGTMYFFRTASCPHAFLGQLR